MKWLKRAVAALIGLVALVVVIGMFLPAGFQVERSLLIAAPPEKIWALLEDPRQWKRWTVWNQRDPAMAVSYGGPPSGAGARWSWQSSTEGNGEMEFTEAVAPTRLGYRLAFPDVGMTSTGEITLTPEAGGVRVRWTNAGRVGRSPIDRWFALAMDALVGPDFEAGLANLRRLVEAP